MSDDLNTSVHAALNGKGGRPRSNTPPLASLNYGSFSRSSSFSSVSSTSVAIKNENEWFTSVRTTPLAALMLCVVVFNEIQINESSWLNDRWRFVLVPILMFAVLALVYLILRAESRRMRNCGYLSFYKRLARVSIVPFTIAAIFSSVSAVLFTFLDEQQRYLDMSKSTLLQVIISCEDGLLMLVLCFYMWLTVRHNVAKPMPDAHQVATDQQPLVLSLNNKSAGSMSSSSSIDKPEHLIRKQAALIGYLEAQTKALSKELLRLKQQSEFDSQAAHGMAYGHRDRDQAHLLRAKDQELRTMSAEFDLLQDKLHKAQTELKAKSHSIRALRASAKSAASETASVCDKYDHLQKEHEHLVLLVDVEREANSEAQKLIDRLSSQQANNQNSSHSQRNHPHRNGHRTNSNTQSQRFQQTP